MPGPRQFAEFQPSVPYSPVGYCIVLTAAQKGRYLLHLVHPSFTVWTTRYLICLLPTLSRLSVSCRQKAAFATGVPLISTHFTATLEIPLSSLRYSRLSVSITSRVKPWYFTTDLTVRLRALYTQ